MTMLSERYGTGARTSSKALVALVVVVVGAGLSWLVWVMLEHGRPEVQSSMVSFDPTSEHAAVATFSVVRSSTAVEASCLLRAFAGDHTIVGEANVTVGPGGEVQQTLTETVRTEREATSVDVVGCRSDGQTQRR